MPLHPHFPYFLERIPCASRSSARVRCAGVGRSMRVRPAYPASAPDRSAPGTLMVPANSCRTVVGVSEDVRIFSPRTDLGIRRLLPEWAKIVARADLTRDAISGL